jgi:acyl carrier protein
MDERASPRATCGIDYADPLTRGPRAAKVEENRPEVATAIDGGAEKETVMERVVELLREIADVQGVELPSERESLFDAGVLDSFGLLEFITGLEKDLNIKILDEDLIPSNFDTIEKIRGYLNNYTEA